MQFDSALRINPFARLLFYYLCGIILGSETSILAPVLIWVTGISLLISFLLLIFVSYRPFFRTDRITGAIAGFIFILAGFLSYSVYHLNGEIQKASAAHICTAVLEIIEPVSETKKSIKSIADLKCSCNREQKDRGSNQKILVYFGKDSLAQQLRPGDRALCKINLTRIPAPMNPDEFDYCRYLATKKVFNQAFVPSASWLKLPNTGQSLKAISYNFRQVLMDKYSLTKLNPTLLNVLAAITLGYKSEIDIHTRQAFSKAGVMHIMALSGFNVAVIAIAINFLLFFFSRIKFGNVIKAVSVILFIWFFAFITGLSPSVTRASLMISLVLIGKEMHRNVNVTNILYASAFILLALSPGLIHDLSFQLSFAAVFGIIIFQPALNRLVQFRIKIVQKIWQLFTVSVAAQFATMPLTLYYFHQFPVYFWITNLYVVPLVSVIICASGFFLIVSSINPLLVVAGKVLSFLVTLLYKSILLIEIMPFAVIQNIRINSLQLVLMMFFIVIIAFYVFYKRTLYLVLGLSIIVLLQISGLIDTYRINHQKILLVGHVKNSSVINLTEGRKSLLLTSDSLSYKNIQHALGDFWIKRGISDQNIRYEQLPVHNMIFSFENKNIAVLNSQSIAYNHEYVDFLIITGKVRADSNIISDVSPGIVIIDSSVPAYRSGMWESICKKAETPCWIVSRKGAWIIGNGNTEGRQSQSLAGL